MRSRFLSLSGSDPSVFCALVQVYTYKQNALTRQKVQPMHHSSVRGVEDMATLEDLHDGAIMHNLHQRYQQRQIYVSSLHTATAWMNTFYLRKNLSTLTSLVFGFSAISGW